MKFSINFGDTNFIGVANADRYNSFVDDDWELDILLEHFVDEMGRGHILVFQMTEEGIEHSWKVTVEVGTGELVDKYFRRAIGYIEVTENRLYLVDYDCLTMAAQFEDEKVPDQNCSKYKVEIENGFYKVEVFQYYDVDHDKYIGTNETDILLYFIKVPVMKPNVEKVFWCTY